MFRDVCARRWTYRRCACTTFATRAPRCPSRWACKPATVQRILRHSSITVTTGTYVEVVEAVQRDALDSMSTLFAHAGDDSRRPLSAKLSTNGSE
jgi:hypothetical protein